MILCHNVHIRSRRLPRASESRSTRAPVARRRHPFRCQILGLIRSTIARLGQMQELYACLQHPEAPPTYYRPSLVKVEFFSQKSASTVLHACRREFFWLSSTVELQMNHSYHFKYHNLKFLSLIYQYLNLSFIYILILTMTLLQAGDVPRSLKTRLLYHDRVSRPSDPESCSLPSNHPSQL